MSCNFVKNLEAIKRRRRSLKLQSISILFESRKFEKVKGSNKVKCVQKKYFNYIIDKIISLRRNFSKALVILSWFLLLLLSFFLLVVHISFAFHFELFKVSFFATLLFKYMKIWYFHGQYNIKQMVWEKIKYLIIFLIYVM